MAGDHRFETAFSEEKEGGPVTMCEVLDRIEEKGRKEGRREGALLKARETAIRLKLKNFTPEEIAQTVDVELSLVKKWLN